MMITSVGNAKENGMKETDKKGYCGLSGIY
jgi:hypothetical protein